MRFNKLDVPYQWREEFTKYPHGYSVFEAMSKWVKQVNDMITNINQWNEYLGGFTSTFGEVPPQMVELQREMEALLSRVDSDLTSITDLVTGLADTLMSHLNDYATEIGDVEALTTTSKVVVGAINEVNTNKANKVQEAWITPTLLNGATNDPDYPVQYFKDQFGIVHFRGKANIVSNDTVLISLPSGYRPLKGNIRMSFIVARGIMAGNMARIMVNGGWGPGALYVITPMVDIIHLDGVSYSTT